MLILYLWQALALPDWGNIAPHLAVMASFSSIGVIVGAYISLRIHRPFIMTYVVAATLFVVAGATIAEPYIL